MHSGIALLMTCAAIGGGACDDGVPQIEVQLRAADDSVETEVTAEEAVLVITSSRGIGRATVTLREGDWPERLRLRINLTNLEGIEVRAGPWRLQSFLEAKQTEVEYQEAVADDAGEDTPAPAERPAEADLQLVMQQVEGEIEVELPPALLEQRPSSIELQWVDWYR